MYRNLRFWLEIQNCVRIVVILTITKNPPIYLWATHWKYPWVSFINLFKIYPQYTWATHQKFFYNLLRIYLLHLDSEGIQTWPGMKDQGSGTCLADSYWLLFSHMVLPKWDVGRQPASQSLVALWETCYIWVLLEPGCSQKRRGHGLESGSGR